MKFFVQKRTRQVNNSGRITQHYYSSPEKPDPVVRKSSRHSVLSTAKRVLTGVVVFAAVLIIISLDHRPDISVDSKQYRSSATYSQGVDAAFNGWRNLTKVTVNRGGIERAIQQRFPEVQQVSVSTPLYTRRPKVTLEIAPPEFTLSGSPGTFGEHTKYVIASNGKLVGLATGFPQIKELPNLTDQAGSSAKIGEVVLGQGTASFILAVIAQCRNNNVPVESFNLAANSQEVDLRTKDKKYFVKFNLSNDPATQIGQYLASREQLAKSGDPSEYLDVRVDGRIFYK